jgi:FAD/FMN-containing dehydrogenase
MATVLEPAAPPTPSVDTAGAEALRKGLRGALLLPGDPGFDPARRVWNTGIDRKPALIARCAGAADVMRAVDFARDRGLAVAVRGGGHGMAGHGVCEGGVMLDLSPMKGVRVDPARRTAQVQGGVTWGELDHETQAHGLATTGGKVTTIGVAGLTLGGGYGWLMRKHGLACDNLLSADVVTADGRLRTVGPGSGDELFWGLRGGGGNFGVATSLEFRLHPVGPLVTGGLLIHPAEDAGELLRFYRGFMENAPDELLVLVAFKPAPPAPFVPRHLHDAPSAIVAACWAGRPEEGERVLAPLRAFGRPFVDRVGPMPYARVQRLLDGAAVPGHRVAVRSDHLARLDDACIDTLVAHAARVTSPLSVMVLIPLGGAVARVGEDDTAFSHRGTAFDYAAYSLWDDPREAERHTRWAAELGQAMQPFSTGVYVNEMGDEGEARVRAAYNPGTWARLVELKRRYDPGNLFRHNHNVPPAG